MTDRNTLDINCMTVELAEGIWRIMLVFDDNLTFFSARSWRTHEECDAFLATTKIGLGLDRSERLLQ
jgi:hypothetical protein